MPEAGEAVGLVWMMPVGHAWCSAETVSQADGELELALGTVTVRESRRARRTAPTRPVATSVLLGDGTIVAGRLLDVSDGGAALVVPDDSIRPGLVVHVTFTAAGEAPVEADCVVMHTTARGDETLVGLAVETGDPGSCGSPGSASSPESSMGLPVAPLRDGQARPPSFPVSGSSPKRRCSVPVGDRNSTAGARQGFGNLTLSRMFAFPSGLKGTGSVVAASFPPAEDARGERPERIRQERRDTIRNDEARGP